MISLNVVLSPKFNLKAVDIVIIVCDFYHTGAFSISHSFLQMLNLEWTLCTDACTIEELRNRGIYVGVCIRVSVHINLAYL